MFKKVRWLVLIFIVITVSAIAALKVKSSFIKQPSLSELKNINCRVEYRWKDQDKYNLKYCKVESLGDLEKNSQVILKVRVIGDGDNVAYSLRRECKVIDLIKGNIKDETIYIYEPSYIWATKYCCEQGYLAMENDKEYIVFLNKIENSEYATKEELSNGYIFTNPPFSKYSLGEEATLIKPDSEKSNIYFNKVSSLPVFFDEQKYIDLYNKILSEIEKRY